MGEGPRRTEGHGLVNGRLYVADIDKLVEIDAESGKIIARYDAPGAQFLNDVAAAPDGTVYVSIRAPAPSGGWPTASSRSGWKAKR